MTINSNEARERALREGKKAMAQHELAGQAVREKTARLRALRLAKEAADREAAGNLPEVQKKPGKAAKAVKTAKSAKKEPLAGWLSAQRGEGRRG